MSKKKFSNLKSFKLIEKDGKWHHSHLSMKNIVDLIQYLIKNKIKIYNIKNVGLVLLIE